MQSCFRSWIDPWNCAQPHLGVGEQGEVLGHQVAGPLHGEVAEGHLDVLEGKGCNISGQWKTFWEMFIFIVISIVRTYFYLINP